MPTPTRQRSSPTDDWTQLQLHIGWPEQTHYELIRPVVLFGFTPAERAQQTGISAQTIYRRATQFDTAGMRSLFEAEESPDSKRLLPSNIRRVIAELKAEYPPFRPNEVATICFVRFNRRPSRTTIQKIWADEPASPTSRRRFPPYATIRDPVQRRGAIIRLHAEGWNVASIAGYLETSRPTVYTTLQRWIEEGVHGLTDRPPLPIQPATKMTLQAIDAVRKLQVNPLLGEFRIHAALLQMGIRLSPRTCGRILQRNRKLYRLHHTSDHEPQEMPFKATRRHQYWTVDIRYIDHSIDDANVYVIAILENYSRAMVASAITRTQNLTAYLRVLHAAVSR